MNEKKYKVVKINEPFIFGTFDSIEEAKLEVKKIKENSILWYDIEIVLDETECRWSNSHGWFWDGEDYNV